VEDDGEDTAVEGVGDDELRIGESHSDTSDHPSCDRPSSKAATGIFNASTALLIILCLSSLPSNM